MCWLLLVKKGWQKYGALFGVEDTMEKERIWGMKKALGDSRISELSADCGIFCICLNQNVIYSMEAFYFDAQDLLSKNVEDILPPLTWFLLNKCLLQNRTVMNRW